MERHELARILGSDTGVPGPVHSDGRLLAETDPDRFKRRFAALASGSGPLVLCDPGWGAVERGRIAELFHAAGAEFEREGWLWIPTGGSGGRLRFACHDQTTLLAAVEGFRSHFGMDAVNAVGVLPLHHVSGLMAWLRCVLSGGRHLAWNWRALEEGRLPPVDDGDWVISLVPTQLQRLLGRPDTLAWLRRFSIVFLGGAPAWPSLLEAAREAQLPLSTSYGMTETAAMVAALRPAEFLSGAEGAGCVMPHARVRITGEGVIAISGRSLFRGYAGEPVQTGEFCTEDLARFDDHGYLHIEGRRDAMIITGGEKVAPVEVEEAIRAAGWDQDLAVIGLPDPVWGSCVVACLPRPVDQVEQTALEAVLRGKLSAYKLPKRWLAIQPWPRTPQGKINRAQLAEAALRLQARD